jgi:hypothetical protein
MPVIETVLIYGVIPLAVFLLLAAVTVLPGRGKDRTRYRPGQPWTAEPVWYEPHPDTVGGHGDDAHGAGHAALGRGATALALTSGEHADAPRRTAAGGARGTW